MVGLRWRAERIAWDLGMGTAVGLLAGTASFAFLWLLEGTLRLRAGHLWLVGLLPAFGIASAWLYRRWGGESERGSGLILDEVLEFHGRVPSRMAPLVLAGTLLTHLGGGSAGREGTAVQMGASLARTIGKLPWPWLRLTRSRQRLLLMAGVSAGFGSLFGTPVAGALFGMEVIAIGKIHYEGLLVCTMASLAGDGICRLLGAAHPHVHPAALGLTPALGVKLALFAVPVALVAGGFSELTHRLAARTRALHPYLRAGLGGCAVIALALAFRTTDFLNLGTVWLPRVFQGTGPVPPWAFAAKFLFTVVTLGFGFKGGEVTPLFVMGALLGTALAPALGLPGPFLAAVGFIAVFAAASNTPIASTLMGIELFGGGFAGPLVITSFLAYILVGHRGIYGGTRIQTRKN
ncbi:chloride channel protein [Mesoterricola silvestris]|uniref:Voltage-gated chloride channel protein n=1 Tax=Mesoterricola silvestris TaxID=2927979 RepID=A0AA48K8D8_9BACT|nr:chloride channel protein [Mesoterricola silvestris]BDU72814.1 voltage-gated chloride channel protein [Mesoterricola silvestris]